AGLTILHAMTDTRLFGSTFEPAETWTAWRSALSALFALPLGPEASELYRRHTGRTIAPSTPFREAWWIVGRRGGKSQIAALVAVFLACFRDYRIMLAPGERGTVMVIAADRRQARVVFRYVLGLLESVPILARMIEARRVEAVDLTNRVTIE